MTTDEFLDTAIAERDAAIERRVREEVAAEIQKRMRRAGQGFAYYDALKLAAKIARGGAA